jgi:hypothetical protein
MRWIDLERGQPDLEAIARRKLIKPGVLLIGTTRKDGTARISGIEPLLMDGHLWLSMMEHSTKAHDLYRDPRLVLHSIVTGPEAGAEVKVRGTARREHDQHTHQHYAEKVTADIGWQPVVGHFALFAVDINDITYISFDETTGAQHVAQWPANIEYIRPSLSPTKLGPPQPIRRLTQGR